MKKNITQHHPSSKVYCLLSFPFKQLDDGNNNGMISTSLAKKRETQRVLSITTTYKYTTLNNTKQLEPVFYQPLVKVVALCNDEMMICTKK